MATTLQRLESLTAEDGARIAAPLLEFNERAGPPMKTEAVAIALDHDGARVEGGLWGEIVYDWLHVEIVPVPDRLRGAGVGKGLMREAERIALAAGCRGVWLDTFSFQARHFYESQGYAVVGMIPDHPRNGCRYFMSKTLTGGSAGA